MQPSETVIHEAALLSQMAAWVRPCPFRAFKWSSQDMAAAAAVGSGEQSEEVGGMSRCRSEQNKNGKTAVVCLLGALWRRKHDWRRRADSLE